MPNLFWTTCTWLGVWQNMVKGKHRQMGKKVSLPQGWKKVIKASAKMRFGNKNCLFKALVAQHDTSQKRTSLVVVLGPTCFFTSLVFHYCGGDLLETKTVFLCRCGVLMCKCREVYENLFDLYKICCILLHEILKYFYFHRFILYTLRGFFVLFWFFFFFKQYDITPSIAALEKFISINMS